MSERAQITLQVVIVVVVLAAAVYGIVSSAQAQPPQVVTVSAGPDASLIAQTLRSATPPVAPSPTPAVVTLPPTPSPTPTPRPIRVQPYSFGERAYVGVQADAGTELVAPFDARVEVVVYQIVDGEFRSGTDLAGQPSYPYFFLITDDRIMKLRPGALTTDTEILVRESQVRTGTPLFRVIGTAPSSWHFRYDASVGAQVIVSLETTGGRDLDAAPFVRAR